MVETPNGQGVKCIAYGDDPPTVIEIEPPSKKAAKSKPDNDLDAVAKSLAKKLDISVKAARKLLED